MDKVFLNLFGEKSQYNTFLQRINGVFENFKHLRDRWRGRN